MKYSGRCRNCRWKGPQRLTAKESLEDTDDHQNLSGHDKTIILGILESPFKVDIIEVNK
jgi:hypothetical protein